MDITPSKKSEPLVVELLDRYADLLAAIAVIEMNKSDLVATILSPDIKEKLNEIDIEFAEKIAEAQEKAESLKEKIKAAVLDAGFSVKGDFFQAVYSAGRSKWNDKLLLRLASKTPAIMGAREYSDPSVTLRKV